mgnify:CR=1 FL=1
MLNDNPVAALAIVAFGLDDPPTDIESIDKSVDTYHIQSFINDSALSYLSIKNKIIKLIFLLNFL